MTSHPEANNTVKGNFGKQRSHQLSKISFFHSFAQNGMKKVGNRLLESPFSLLFLYSEVKVD